MAQRSTIFRRVLALEAAAFGLIVAVTWLDELLDLPHRLFGAPASPSRTAEALLESTLTLLLGLAVVLISRRAFARIAYLESLVVMCAWCGRVRDADQEWQPVEVFLEREHLAATSHGICDDCVQRLEAQPHAVRN